MKKVFCNYCTTFKGYERDLGIHEYRKHFAGGYIKHIEDNLEENRKFLKKSCIYQCRETTLYFIFTFKPIFGKDITNLIAKLIYESRHDLPLWNISVPNKKWKNKIDKEKRLDIKESLDLKCL